MNFGAFRGIERKEVLILQIAEGKGVEGDVVRIVTYVVDAKTLRTIVRMDPESK